MMLQRPLMRKNPPAVPNVPKTNDAARILAVKAQTILELSLSARKTTYKDFLIKFSKCTRTDFEIELRKVQQSDPGFSLNSIVDQLSFFGHLCTLQRGNRDDVFVFTPFQANVPPLPTRAKKVPIRDRAPVDTHSTISGQPSQNETSPRAYEKPAQAAAPSSLPSEILKKHQDYSGKLFRKPAWPWLTEEHRESNRAMFLKFLQSTENGLSDKRQVFIDAKQLATELWQSTITNFPHTLYLLHLLGKHNPNGVAFFDFQPEMSKVMPETWREMNVLCEDIISEPSLLLLLNLIIPSSDSGMVKVNQLINYVGFHEIWDREISMIYFFISSTPHSKSSESVHEFMSSQFPKWSKVFDKRSGPDRVNKVCQEKNKMFRTENNLHKSKSHLYKVGVPMFFPSSSVISPCDS